MRRLPSPTELPQGWQLIGTVALVLAGILASGWLSRLF
jgi:hypothetical protein